MENHIPDNVSKLFLLFKQAVEDERRAQIMYKEAMDLCEDDSTREVLEELYEDEVRHERKLLKRYNALRREHGVDQHGPGTPTPLPR
jgi:rubrerythrin